MEWTESGRTPAGIAFDFSATPSGGSPASRVPRRIRRRLAESRGGGPPTAEEIDARLREADLRRQQFHAWLSSKARPKPRSPSWSSQEEDPGQRLEAKLYAAEQKRLNLIAKLQTRLARLDELRQAARTSVELRMVKEREKLGTKVESRVQQAQANRMLLLKATMQRRVAAQERKSRSLLQRINKEAKYKERVRTAISLKRAAAEQKRLRMLEAEKTRARARFLQARRVAKLVCSQREIERRKLKEQLEERLQRARWQRAEFLKQRGGLQSSGRVYCKKVHKQGETLSRKLGRCWRQFVKSKGTTLALVKDFEALGINEESVRHMRFDQLAGCIQSAKTLQIVRSLLDRLQNRLIFSLLSSRSQPENIDHLLTRVGSPSKRGSSSRKSHARGQARRNNKETKFLETRKLPRYPVRVVLCAYMILGHPDAVFNGQGDCEKELADSALNLVKEFELLIRLILNGPQEIMLDEAGTSSLSPVKHTFRSQLAAFDAAWRSYLYCFVVWKVKDAKLLEEDLVRAACQLELSMMQACKLTLDGQGPDLTPDMRAIQNQVTEDQRLLREKVKHLSGDDGIERMESALSDARSMFFEAKESGNSLVTHVAHISTPLSRTPSGSSDSPSDSPSLLKNERKSSSVVRSLFGGNDDSQVISTTNAKEKSLLPGPLSLENEFLVNEILHDTQNSFIDSFDANAEANTSIKAKVKSTMEKAFWDGITESLTKEDPDHERIVGLVKEVRDELYEMAPQVLKQEIKECIDIDILTQLLSSGSVDLDYLGKVLEYSLVTLQKMSAPAKEAEMKRSHEKMLQELAEVAQSNGIPRASLVMIVVKGLRFVLEEVKSLKKEISKAHILMMVPIVRSAAGVEYLQKAFGDRYGPPCDAARNLSLTKQWLSSLQSSVTEWDEHIEFVMTWATNQESVPVGMPLRSGGSSLIKPPSSSLSCTSANTGTEECTGEKLDVLLRIGLLKLISNADGLTEAALPETLKLNFRRLRTIQGNLQKIIVISISMLVLRQILVSEKIVSSSGEMESIVSGCVRSLSKFLEHDPDVGIMAIIDTIIDSCVEEKLADKKEVMARVLVKSLQAGDAVFSKVFQSLYLATRLVVLAGSGVRGKGLAEGALRRVGASMLLDQVVSVAETLILIAKVSGQVHRPWYEPLLLNLG